jgi:hypothetical protein
MNENSNTTLQQYMRQSEQTAAMDTGMMILLIVFAITYLSTTIYTLNHCLRYCFHEDKTSYTLTILLFPLFGIVFYWLHGPYELPVPAPSHHEPVPSEELSKPGAAIPAGHGPSEQQAATPAVPVRPPKAMTASQPMPRPAKPIHIIAEERKATTPPFPPL